MSKKIKVLLSALALLFAASISYADFDTEVHGEVSAGSNANPAFEARGELKERGMMAPPAIRPMPYEEAEKMRERMRERARKLKEYGREFGKEVRDSAFENKEEALKKVEELRKKQLEDMRRMRPANPGQVMDNEEMGKAVEMKEKALRERKEMMEKARELRRNSGDVPRFRNPEEAQKFLEEKLKRSKSPEEKKAIIEQIRKINEIRKSVADKVREEAAKRFGKIKKHKAFKRGINVAAKKAAYVISKLNRVINRFEHIFKRVESRIERLQKAGVNTESTNEKIKLAKEQFENVKQKYESTKERIKNADVKTPEDLVVFVKNNKADFVEIVKALKGVKKTLKEAIVELKKAVSDFKGQKGQE